MNELVPDDDIVISYALELIFESSAEAQLVTPSSYQPKTVKDENTHKQTKNPQVIKAVAPHFPDIKEIQLQLQAFLGGSSTDKNNENKCLKFCTELWKLLLEAQDDPDGVPPSLVAEKKRELLDKNIKREEHSSRYGDRSKRGRGFGDREDVIKREEDDHDYRGSRYREKRHDRDNKSSRRDEHRRDRSRYDDSDYEDYRSERKRHKSSHRSRYDSDSDSWSESNLESRSKHRHKYDEDEDRHEWSRSRKGYDKHGRRDRSVSRSPSRSQRRSYRDRSYRHSRRGHSRYDHDSSDESSREPRRKDTASPRDSSRTRNTRRQITMIRSPSPESE